MKPVILFVSTTDINGTGLGAFNRNYQILTDLQSALPDFDVVSFSWNELSAMAVTDKEYRRPGLPLRLRRRVSREIRRARTFVWGTPDGLGNPCLMAQYNNLACLDYYREFARRVTKDRPAVSVVASCGLERVVEANQELGVPTVVCPHNIDSLAFHATTVDTHNSAVRGLRHLVWEIGVLARCQFRLMISRIDLGLVTGMGFPANLYPYRPVEKVLRQLWQVRQRRKATRQEPGLVLLVGTAEWTPTADSMRWVLERAREEGLPPGGKLAIVGSGTDRLIAVDDASRGIIGYGRLPENKFQELLIKAECAIVPAVCGFGMVTRIADFFCAGIPIVTSKQAAYAFDLPPGIQVIENQWAEFKSALESRPKDVASDETCLEWLDRQKFDWLALLQQATTCCTPIATSNKEHA